VLWEAAQGRTMIYFGQTWTADDQAASIGGPLERVVAHMSRRTGADEGHVARVLVTEIEHMVATLPAEWMPGARSLLEQATAAGVPTAIVSNSWRVLLDLLLANIDFPVDLTVSASEVGRPKPHPDPYLRACELLGADPRLSVVVEDSPTGAAAGLAAGCQVLAVGAAVADLREANLRHVTTLEAVTMQSLAALFGGDGIQDPQA
jgi:HAD superfamily hydrolase (TIGR01509 family)